MSPARFVLVVAVCLIECCAAIPKATQAQQHVNPPHGGEGEPGPFPHSFVIEWEEVPGAIRYEYVLSDNPQCFSGCPGDTRQNTVTSPRAVEFNLQENTWYYWITRVYYSDSDVSHWSNISSFLARSPEIATHIADFAPNPATQEIWVHLDWGVNPAALFVQVTLFDLLGRRVFGPIRFDKSSPRFERFRIPLDGVASGIYVAQIVADGNPDNRNNRRSQTVVIY